MTPPTNKDDVLKALDRASAFIGGAVTAREVAYHMDDGRVTGAQVGIQLRRLEMMGVVQANRGGTVTTYQRLRAP